MLEFVLIVIMKHMFLVCVFMVLHILTESCMCLSFYSLRFLALIICSLGELAHNNLYFTSRSRKSVL